MNFPLNRPDRGLDSPGLRLAVPWQPSPPEAEDDSFDLRAMFLPVWRRKWLVLLATLVGSALAILVALNLQDRYTASARVLFEPERIRIIDLDNVLVNREQTTTALQNQIEILRSANLLQRVIDILRLATAPEFNPALRPTPPSLFERAVRRLGPSERTLQRLAEFGLIDPPEPPDMTDEQRADRLRAHILEMLDRNLQLSPLRNSQVIEISYSSPDPVMAANIANAVGEQYIVVQAERKRDAIAAASETLSVRVQDLENRLNSAEEAVRIAQLELTLDSKYGTTLIAKQLEFLNDALNEAHLERSTLEERHERVAEAVDDPANYPLVPEFRDSDVVASLMAREREVVDQIAGVRAIVADEQSPQLVQLRARLDRVRRDMRLEAENVERSLAISLEAAARREAGLQGDLSNLEDRAVEHARTEMRIGRLEREAEAARVIYETFLNRLQETREQANLQTPDASFLTRATVPPTADTTARVLVAAAGGLGGLGAGIALVFLLEMLNNAFRDPDEIEAATGVPVLASIPMAGWRKRPRRLMRQVLRNPESAFAESVRNLRTSLLLQNAERPPKTIMFASSLPGEGKTTTAMLLAVLSRQMDKTAVVVDCDLRRRTLAKSFSGRGPAKGLVAVLEGSATLDQAIWVDADSGVHFLAPGVGERMPRNPADLLSSPRFRELVDELRASYDLVLVDTPPALAVTDARIVAQAMDAIVYLIAWNRTSKGAVNHGLRELASVSAKITGIALTRVDEARAARQIKNHFYYKRRYKDYLAS